ncbi:hypothetical protein WN66_06722 [Saccharomyces cerevisiae]|uniref:Putative uncharacterized protein YPR160C-A n=2 Tax=Saccharomyces cerevisiae TaxID=4932 RepID=YP160_YEAST|nr:RecName: Full=Putative uncharacterized protein YPR160C-A [Saccharomyces cerevisiae S288C]AAL79298.1 unknown [Saccharomyces cerevisiae]KZV07674.1 hypothetical protein WN66_06722 [Saccharomyces cerevisiae]CAY87117.1 EC1118_1P2_5006p [Saccharomyces cerevisiae EC1118]
MVVLINSECNSATPLTLCEPTIAKKAILICLSGEFSSMMDIRDKRSTSLGNFLATSCKKNQLISYIISKCLGSKWPKRPTGHFSRASCITVWLV